MTRPADVRSGRIRSPRSGRSAGACLAALGLVLLGACSALPDWSDPTRWSADSSETLAKLSPETIAEAEAEPEGFPNLTSVPNQPPRPLPRPLREQLASRLAMDHAAATSGTVPTAPIPEDAPPPAGIMPQPIPEAPPLTSLPDEPRMPPAPPPAAEPTQTAQVVISSEGVAGASSIESTTFPTSAPGAAAPGGPQLIAVIYFAHGSSSLSGHDRNVLADVAAIRRERGGSLRVIGHASAYTGPTSQAEHSKANLEISSKRANAVVEALIALGVPSDAVTPEARSDTQPVYHEFMPTGEAANRRAEIFLE